MPGSRRPKLIAAAAVAVLVAGGCGGSGSGVDRGEGGTSNTSTSGQRRPSSLTVRLVGCHQFGTNTGIDPVAARHHVPESQELYLDAAGDARFALVAKDCGDTVVDGASTGPAHFSTAWIRITGPAETRTFPDGIPTLAPTDYFHPVLFHTDNAEFARATARFGMPMTRADTMTFDPPRPGTQSGSAVDTQRTPALTYRWSVENVNPFPSTPGGIVHVLKGSDDRGAPLTYDISCVAQGGFAGNHATLEVEPGSSLEDIVGTGFRGLGNGPDVDCTVTITRD